MRFLPMQLVGIVSLVLSCFCALLNFSRGVHIISDTHGHIDEVSLVVLMIPNY